MADVQPHLDDHGFVILPDEMLDWHDPQAIVDCELCDDDGYHGHMVCDHVDHTAAAQRGMAKVRQILTRSTRGGIRTADTPKDAQREAQSHDGAS